MASGWKCIVFGHAVIFINLFVIGQIFLVKLLRATLLFFSVFSLSCVILNNKDNIICCHVRFLKPFLGIYLLFNYSVEKKTVFRVSC